MHVDEPSQPASEQLGRYRLLERLGQGGMGTVYLALDTRLDRRVAVKVLPPNSVHDPDAVARFQREARALARLSHPGIVQAYDSDAADARHFLVMEYVEGTSLGQLVKERGRLAPTLAADYVYQAALALDHAHRQGLIHRDLKPSNLLLTAEGRVKILDLGLARFLQDQIGDADLTRDGVGLGTPDYAAPEQFLNARAADVRSDVYSLGCTLYQLIAGRVPFPGSSLSEKARAHERDTPAPLEELCPEVPAGLALAVARMMAKRPRDRFASAAAAAEALAPYVAGASITFGALKQSASWTAAQLSLGTVAPPQRKRWLVPAGLALAALALAVGAWAVFFRDGNNSGAPAPGPVAAGQPKKDVADDGKKQQKPGGAAVKPAAVELLTVARDGSGQYPTLAAALAAVKGPKAVVRILDDATYEESVTVARTAAQEGLTIEAPHGALLSGLATGSPALRITGVRGVTVRGLRVRAVEHTAVQVARQSAGTTLDGLEFLPPLQASAAAISIDRVETEPGEPPVVVRGCRVHPGYKHGVHVRGTSDGGGPGRCSGVIVRDNRIEGSKWGVWLGGVIERVHVVGNLIWDVEKAGIQIEHLREGSAGLLIANNTTLYGLSGFVVRDNAVHGKDVLVSGNLFLGGRAADMVFVDSGGQPIKDRGPGDAQELARRWRFERNWREFAKRELQDSLAVSRIPPSATEVVQAKVEGLVRNANDPAFLRPGAGALAEGGAGRNDAELPDYVGALPPAGVEPWDWERTWWQRAARKE